VNGSGLAQESNMSSEMELERVWQSRVNAAWQVYDESTREFNRLVVAHSNGNSTKFPSASEVIRQARRRQSLALKEYMQALRIYTDLIIYGTAPREPQNEINNRAPADEI
jgi:hypothetical protein